MKTKCAIIPWIGLGQEDDITAKIVDDVIKVCLLVNSNVPQ
jgi:hypothetical protein